MKASSIESFPTPRAGDMIEVHGGKVLAGSSPGTAHRAPGAEMDDAPLEVEPFLIDVLPYPNDPEQAPRTQVSFDQASELCRAEGKRLCHELEWELACEGPRGTTYPYGATHDLDRYTAANEIVSPLGVRAMGSLGEWTFGDYGGETKGVKAVRGSKGAEGTAATRRCSHRVGLEPSETEPWLGFRCCKGSTPALTYRTPTYVPPFERLELSHEEFQAMIRSVPELARIHEGPVMFDREDLFKMRQRGGFEGSISAIGAVTYKAIKWVPTVGEELVVATGRNGRDAFIVALYELPGGRFAHAASYVLVNEDDPVLLAYTKNPRHIRWLPCWDCDDGGLLTLDDEGLVDISQRW